MKICWDNIEGIKLTKNGTFKKGTITYVYKDKCKECGHPYFTYKSRPGRLCSRKCVDNSKEYRKLKSMLQKGKPSAMAGKKHSAESKRKISESRKNKYFGKNHPMYGRKHSEETKRKMSKPRINFTPWNKGKKFSEESKRKMRNNHADFTLDKHPRWKGGKSFEPYCLDWTKEYKNFIKERDGNRCLNPDCFNNSNILVVHHINYNKKFCATTNLITLCNSCNSRANSSRDWHKHWYQAIIKKRYGGK